MHECMTYGKRQI